MRSPKSVAKLEELGRVRLSRNFFMRDFLYSEIANLHSLPNIPEDPDLAIAAGTRLCEAPLVRSRRPACVWTPQCSLTRATAPRLIVAIPDFVSIPYLPQSFWGLT